MSFIPTLRHQDRSPDMDGTFIWTLTNLTPVKEDGDTLLIDATALDIT